MKAPSIIALLICFQSYVYVSATSDEGPWFSVFVAFSGNGKSVYDAWRTPAATTEPIEQWKQSGKKNHLRHSVIDKWSEIKPLRVKVEFYYRDQRQAWMLFNGEDTTNESWFCQANLLGSSFGDLTSTTCTATNFFSMAGDTRWNSDRRFFVNRSYDGCSRDHGWFVVLDKQQCDWEKRGTVPVFLFTRENTPRNWNTDVDTSCLPDRMEISIKTA